MFDLRSATFGFFLSVGLLMIWAGFGSMALDDTVKERRSKQHMGTAGIIVLLVDLLLLLLSTGR